ncbi:MAG: 50S ribosomal protein L3, partial [SAR202 cluster bacterium]|nr:50S ribosomal protein L3 [SAR202 cluster bacterium]
MKGIIGKKIGMTQTFSEKGEVQPVTLVQAGPCVITQIKTQSNDGYNAIQIGYETVKKANKPTSGHLQRTGNYKYLREIRVEELDELQVGQLLNVQMFSVGEIIRVTANSKGRGFAGGMKRHGFHGGPKTHGQSDRWRAPGSVGAGSTPGRVFKGKRMAGHYGNETITTRGLEVVSVDLENNIISIKGAVPGARDTLVMVAGEGNIPVYVEEVIEDIVEETAEEVEPTNEAQPVVEEVVEETAEEVEPTNEAEEVEEVAEETAEEVEPT